MWKKVKQIAYHFLLRKKNVNNKQCYSISKVCNHDKCEKEFQHTLQSKKNEQKQNSLHAKNSKVPKYVTIESKHRFAKRPLELSQEKTSNPSENDGDPRKNENI
jgi:hypothetical protein